MDRNNCLIRLERKEDYAEVENLVRESFWNVYRPGCMEHYVLHVLRNDPAFVKELDFVMEEDGYLIGQNMFMKTIIEADDDRIIHVLTMGPICIVPDLQRKGYGKDLSGAFLSLFDKRSAAFTTTATDPILCQTAPVTGVRIPRKDRIIAPKLIHMERMIFCRIFFMVFLVMYIR